MTNFDKIISSSETMTAFLKVVFEEGYVCGYNELNDIKSEYANLDWLNQKYNNDDEVWIDVFRKIKKF